MKNKVNATTRPYAHICTAVDAYLQKEHLNYTEVAKKLCITPAAVSAQLSGKKPFGKRTVMKWTKAFPFNQEFLLQGSGDLISEPEEHPKRDEDVLNNLMTIAYASNSFFIRIAIRSILIGNDNALREHLINCIQREAYLHELANRIILQKNITPEDIEMLKKKYLEEMAWLDNAKWELRNFEFKNSL